jgi:hypothetical protein
MSLKSNNHCLYYSRRALPPKKPVKEKSFCLKTKSDHPPPPICSMKPRGPAVPSDPNDPDAPVRPVPDKDYPANFDDDLPPNPALSERLVKLMKVHKTDHKKGGSGGGPNLGQSQSGGPQGQTDDSDYYPSDSENLPDNPDARSRLDIIMKKHSEHQSVGSVSPSQPL